MTTKRIVALLVAVLMLVALFSACSNTTMSNDEETAIISQYGSELTTYLAEMTTNYIVGNTSPDTYEADLQYAYDNLGMQEYNDAMQARVDRFLVAMGRDAILG